MKWKNVILVMMFVALFSAVVGQILQLGIGDLPSLERQTFVILENVKWLLVVALYIAWRVTP